MTHVPPLRSATEILHRLSSGEACFAVTLCSWAIINHFTHASHGRTPSKLLQSQLILVKVIGLHGLTEDSCLQCRQDDAQASLASRESSPDESLIAEGWIVAGTIMSNRDYRSGKQPFDS